MKADTDSITTPANRRPWLAYALVAALFLLTVSNRLFSEGMFLDGLYYADVALNLAEGNGTFWAPQFTDIVPFYGHPPLAMGLESLGYRLFGDDIAVEKGYSLLVILLSAWLTVLLWRRCGGTRTLGWLPLLLLTLVPLTSTCAVDNMLENTMMVFTLLSALCVLQARQRRFPAIVLAGFALCGAFLTKGFTGLYPLAFPLALWLALRQERLPRALLDTLLMLLSFLLMLAAIFIIWPEARTFFSKYLDIQVAAGIHSPVVSSRITIVVKLFERSLIVLLLTAAVLLIGWRQSRHAGLPLVEPPAARMALALTLLVLCGTLPIMISLKQRAFYLLTVFPFLCVALGLLMQPTLLRWASQLGTRWRRLMAALLAALIIANIAVATHRLQAGPPRFYNPVLLSDMKQVIQTLPPHTTLSIEASMLEEYSLPAYYYRHGHLNMDTQLHPYALLKEELLPAWREAHPDATLQRMALPTTTYHLYQVIATQ